MPEKNKHPGTSNNQMKQAIPVDGDEFLLVLQGLESLKLKLLKNAGELASVKLSRRTKGLKDAVEQGNKVVEEIERLNKLLARLKAMVPPAPTAVAPPK